MSPTSRPSEIANGQSALPTVSADGRYVAFESDANNITANDFNSNTDVFVRDMNTRVATLVSINGGSSGWSNSYAPAISSNGRYVAFHSFVSFVGSDNNGTADIYLRDLQQGQTTLISMTSSGSAGNGVSDHPQVTPDGRYVAFRSSASNLVANDNNGQPDIFVRDLQTNTTQRVSVAANQDEANGYTERRVSISSDGRYIAFESQSSNLVYGDNNGDWDVFIRDRLASSTYLVSVGPGGFSANLGSYYPSMSPDGRYVAFHAWASNLVPNDNNGLPDVFVRDRQTNTTTLVSQVNGNQTNGISDLPTISPDGRYVAFRSGSNNLVTGDSNGVADAFQKDLVTGALTITSSVDSGPSANGESGFPVVVAGPNTVFQTTASNLVPNDTNGVRDIVIRRPSGLKGVTAMPNAAPNASVSVSPTSGNRSTSFRATAGGTDPDGDPLTYQVLWGDGFQSFGQTPSHSYTGTGTFNVRAVTCDQFSACSNPSNPVAVQVAFSNRPPVASLTISPSSGGTDTVFNAYMWGSTDPDGDQLTYSVDWGDGTVTTGEQSSHQYALPGSYTVEGTASDPWTSSSTSRTVEVCVVDSSAGCITGSEVPQVCESVECPEGPEVPEPCTVDACLPPPAVPEPLASVVDPITEEGPAVPIMVDPAWVTPAERALEQATPQSPSREECGGRGYNHVGTGNGEGNNVRAVKATITARKPKLCENDNNEHNASLVWSMLTNGGWAQSGYMRATERSGLRFFSQAVNCYPASDSCDPELETKITPIPGVDIDTFVHGTTHSYKQAYSDNRDVIKMMVDDVVLDETNFDPKKAWGEPWIPQWNGETLRPGSNVPGTKNNPVYFQNLKIRRGCDGCDWISPSHQSLGTTLSRYHAEWDNEQHKFHIWTEN
jgi:Tol biopolymer transport system component